MFKGLRHVRNVLQRGHYNQARCHANVTHMGQPNGLAYSNNNKLCGAAAALKRQMAAPMLQPLSWRQVSGT